MRKSEITTRMKKVFLKASALGAQAACTDEEIGELWNCDLFQNVIASAGED